MTKNPQEEKSQEKNIQTNIDRIENQGDVFINHYNTVDNEIENLQKETRYSEVKVWTILFFSVFILIFWLQTEIPIKRDYSGIYINGVTLYAIIMNMAAWGIHIMLYINPFTIFFSKLKSHPFESLKEEEPTSTEQYYRLKKAQNNYQIKKMGEKYIILAIAIQIILLGFSMLDIFK